MSEKVSVVVEPGEDIRVFRERKDACDHIVDSHPNADKSNLGPYVEGARDTAVVDTKDGAITLEECEVE